MADGRIRLGGHWVIGADGFDSFRQGKSIDEIEQALANDRDFDWSAREAAEAWVLLERARALRAQDGARLQLEQRSTRAAEESARAATASAKWAKWSMLIAAIALLVSAWPYIKTPKSWWPF